MTYRLASLLAALPALVLAGCASTPLATSRDNGALEQEVRELKARVVELQRKAAVNEVEMERLRQQIAAMEGQGGTTRRPVSSTTTTTPPPATGRSAAAPSSGTSSRPGTTGTSGTPVDRDLPVGRITPAPAIEESDLDIPDPEPQPPTPRRTAPATTTTTTPAPTNRGSSGTTTPAPGSRAGIYTPPTATRPATPPAGTGSSGSSTSTSSPSGSTAYRGGPVTSNPPATTAPVTPPPATSGSSASSAPAPEPGSPAAQALYDRGYTLYNQGHFVDAETSFQRFLQGNPDNELADNAQYWIGECRYARGDLRGALDAFRQTAERYPTGNKVPDALLKAGQSLESLGNTEAARETYAEVIRRYSGSAAAAVAEERRTKLN